MSDFDFAHHPLGIYQFVPNNPEIEKKIKKPTEK